MGGGMEEGQEGGEEGGGNEEAMLPGQTARPGWGEGRGQGRRRVAARPPKRNHSPAQPDQASSGASQVRPASLAKPATHKRTTKQSFEMTIGMTRQTWADVFIQITGLFGASNCSK